MPFATQFFKDQTYQTVNVKAIKKSVVDFIFVVYQTTVFLKDHDESIFLK